MFFYNDTYLYMICNILHANDDLNVFLILRNRQKIYNLFIPAADYKKNIAEYMRHIYINKKE